MDGGEKYEIIEIELSIVFYGNLEMKKSGGGKKFSFTDCWLKREGRGKEFFVYRLLIERGGGEVKNFRLPIVDWKGRGGEGDKEVKNKWWESRRKPFAIIGF